MLEALLESSLKEKLLLYLLVNEDSYPNEIARNFGFNLNAVQYQLKKLETAGVLYSQLRGKVRLYGLNPGYAFGGELEALLQKTVTSISASEKNKYYVRRRSPRQPERAQQRSETREKAVKEEKQAETRQFDRKEPENLDFSTD